MLPGIVIAERPILYNRYRLGPGPWLHCDDSARLDRIYGNGFLPLSKPHPAPQRFFAARSLRIECAVWKVEKKRRHQQRAWDRFGLHREALPRASFIERYGEHASAIATAWMEARFGTAYLDPQRLRFVLTHPMVNTVLTWSSGPHLKAFAPLIQGAWGAHYWFVFYNEAPASPQGHGFLMDFLLWVRDEGLPFAYLGSVYGLQSLYKWRGFEGVTFRENDHWCPDKERLGALLAEDDRTSAS